MPYFRVDDAFPQHPKVLAIPRKDRAPAVGLWTLAGAWCAKNLTDGRLAAHMIEELGSSKKYADLLVSTGLWMKTDNGYAFHQFVGWQGASREEVLTKREAEAERKRRWRAERDAERAARHAGTDTPVPDVSQRDNPRTDNGTPPSVRPESEPRPALHYPPLPSPSHPDVPYGDIEDESPRGENAAEADARASNAPLPPEPPLCRKHIGWDRDAVPPCPPCGRLREQWQRDRDNADRPPARPPWCGRCDPDTRQLELDDHTVARCPDCHPRAALLATIGAHQ